LDFAESEKKSGPQRGKGVKDAGAGQWGFCAKKKGGGKGITDPQNQRTVRKKNEHRRQPKNNIETEQEEGCGIKT